MLQFPSNTLANSCCSSATPVGFICSHPSALSADAPRAMASSSSPSAASTGLPSARDSPLLTEIEQLLDDLGFQRILLASLHDLPETSSRRQEIADEIATIQHKLAEARRKGSICPATTASSTNFSLQPQALRWVRTWEMRTGPKSAKVRTRPLNLSLSNQNSATASSEKQSRLTIVRHPPEPRYISVSQQSEPDELEPWRRFPHCVAETLNWKLTSC